MVKTLNEKSNNINISVTPVQHIFRFSFVLFLFSFFFTHAQFYNLPNDYFCALLTEKKLAAKDSSVHTGIKPYIQFYLEKYTHIADTYRVFKYISEDQFLDKVFFDHLIHIKPKSKKFYITADPLLNFEIGRDAEDTIFRKLYSNTRGFIVSGTAGKKLYFETMFAENQTLFPNYIENANRYSLIVPGQGRWKVYNTRGFDYAFSSGFFSWQPYKFLNIQAGHGKHKVGQGYRSLLLSDNSFNYPYIRITQQYFKGRLQYTNIYTSLMNLEQASATYPAHTEPLFQKKAASFQQLSMNITKWLNFGFFQGMIWQVPNSKNVQQFEWQFFNPIIFTNLAYYRLNNKNNLLVGGDINIKITNKISLYGQIMADDLSNNNSIGNGWGYQGGLKYFDAFSVKNLFLQTEINNVTEGSYLSPVTTYTANQSYSHYNQNLAYTPGFGRELIFIADYKFQRIFMNVKYNNQYFTNHGYSLFKNDIVNLNLGYTINPSYNATISFGVLYRSQDYFGFNISNNKTAYLYLSFKTGLYNKYYDF